MQYSSPLPEGRKQALAKASTCTVTEVAISQIE